MKVGTASFAPPPASGRRRLRSSYDENEMSSRYAKRRLPDIRGCPLRREEVESLISEHPRTGLRRGLNILYAITPPASTSRRNVPFPRASDCRLRSATAEDRKGHVFFQLPHLRTRHTEVDYTEVHIGGQWECTTVDVSMILIIYRIYQERMKFRSQKVEKL